jgi:hypothetical protein
VEPRISEAQGSREKSLTPEPQREAVILTFSNGRQCIHKKLLKNKKGESVRSFKERMDRGIQQINRSSK